MWVPSFGHKRALFWQYLGKGATEYTQQCEIWHGTSLSKLIKIPPEPIQRTMWGPSFGHKMAISLPFLGMGATEYTQQCEIWHGTSLGTKIQGEPIWRTMWGPCVRHKSVILWPFVELLTHWVVKWKTRYSHGPLVLFRTGSGFKPSTLILWSCLWYRA